MNWEEKQKKKTIQKQLFVDLTEDEKMIAQLLQKQEQMHIDEINLQSNINSSAVSAALLMMEMNGLVKSLPGKIYKLS
jgi:DNA processing protein